MSVLDDLKQEVFKITKRPDLEQETLSALQKALVTAHLSSFYYFDVSEQVYKVESEEQFISVDLPDRFREVKSVRTDCAKLDFLPSEALFDKHSTMSQIDIYYTGGVKLNVRISAATEKIYLSFYKMPSFTDSWICKNMSQILIDFAAARIFGSSNSQKRDFHMGLYQMGIGELINSAFDK